jgi:hypothetical protein
MYGNLPDWINLVVLIGLAVITWWYAYSTREMARIMKETYEAETTPQLVPEDKNLTQKALTKDKQKIKIRFDLVLTNAGKYLLTVHSVAILADVKQRGDYSDIAWSQPVPLAQNRNYSLSCETTIPQIAENLRVRIDFEDFRGRFHSKEHPLSRS